ncbi:MAG: methylenetetrahydrofolate reductase [Salinarimonas sp.]|nr:methylenetetrahydrofolate reductase [Salinarimonas sp.]
MDGFSDSHAVTTAAHGDLRADAQMAQLLAQASIEIMPRQIADGLPGAGEFPSGAEVFVPLLPGADFDDTLAACRTLSLRGFTPVPHLPARALRDREMLARLLDAFEARGVTSILLIAGDAPRPAGPFPDALSLLAEPCLAQSSITRLYVAGHPEGHPYANGDALMRALQIKQDYARAHGFALGIVTQFTFSAAPVITWCERLAAQGIDAPVRVGVAAPVGMGTLIRFALRCGVGASARFLGRRPDALQALQRFDPLPLIAELARSRSANALPNLAAVHLYCFGGAAQALSWRAQSIAALHARAPIEPGNRENGNAEDAAS